MPKLTVELNLPTQTDIDDFLSACGWTAQSGVTKAEWAKKTIAEFVKEKIKSQRMVTVSEAQRVQTDQVLSQINSLTIS